MYRDAVEALVDTLNKSEWAFSLAVSARFPFRTKDIKAIAGSTPKRCSTRSHWRAAAGCQLRHYGICWIRAFGVAETWPLKNTHALRQAVRAVIGRYTVKRVKCYWVAQGCAEKAIRSTRTVEPLAHFTMKETASVHHRCARILLLLDRRSRRGELRPYCPIIPVTALFLCNALSLALFQCAQYFPEIKNS